MGVKALPVELGLDHIYNLRLAMAGGVNAKAAQAVQELLAVQAVEVGAAVLPFQHHVAVGLRGNRLSVLEPAGADIFVEMMNGLLHHLLFGFCGDVFRVGLDQADDPVKVPYYLFTVCHGSFLLTASSCIPSIMECRHALHRKQRCATANTVLFVNNWGNFPANIVSISIISLFLYF